VELTHELKAARASVLHECGGAAAAEQELAMSRSALGMEQAALGEEWATQAFPEGQASSRGLRITELEVTLSLREEALKVLEVAVTGDWCSPSHPFSSVLCSVASYHCFVYVQSC
jgi:hypothetical protein